MEPCRHGGFATRKSAGSQEKVSGHTPGNGSNQSQERGATEAAERAVEGSGVGVRAGPNPTLSLGLSRVHQDERTVDCYVASCDK